MRTAVWALLAVLASACLPAAAGSVPLEASFRSQGAYHAERTLEGSASATALLADAAGLGATGSLTRAELWRIPLVQAKAPAGPGYEQETWGQPELIDSRDGPGRIDAAGDSLHARLIPSRPEVVDLGPERNFSASIPLPELASADHQRMAGLTSIGEMGTLPAGPFAILGADDRPTVHIGGRHLAFIMHGEVDIEGLQWETGARPALVAPGGAVTTTDHLVAVIHSTEAVWSVQGGDWRIAARGFEVASRGAVAWHHIDGSVSFGELGKTTKGGLLRANGDLEGKAAVDSGGTTWTVSGIVVQAAFDAWSVKAAASAAGLALIPMLAAVLWSGKLRAAIVILVSRAAARGVMEDPLANATRRSILNVLHQDHAVPVRAMSTAIGASLNNVRYHLYILEKADIVQKASPSGAQKRNTAYMLNSGSLMFKALKINEFLVHGVAPHEAETAAQAMATVNSHPLRRRLFEAIESSPGCTIARISDAASAPGRRVPASTLSRHLRILSEAGLAIGRWENGEKRWYPLVSTADLVTEQYMRYIGGLRHRRVLAHLALHGPIGRMSLHDSIKGYSPPQAARALDHLARLGLVHQDDSAGWVVSHKLQVLALPWETWC